MNQIIKASSNGKVFEPIGRIYLPESYAQGRTVVGNRVRARTTISVHGERVQGRNGWQRTAHGEIQGRKVISFNAPGQHSERAAITMVLPDENDPLSRVMVIPGGGIEFTGDQIELANRVVDEGAAKERDRRGALSEKQHIWRTMVFDALQRRMEKHKRNWRTDPAPEHTHQSRKTLGKAPLVTNPGLSTARFVAEQQHSSGLFSAKR